MRNKVKTVFIIAMVLSVLCNTSAFGEQGNIRVVMDGEYKGDIARTVDGELYLPARFIENALSTNVKYDETEGTVYITGNKNENLIPEIIKKVSPCVVGVIGNIKSDLYTGSKYRDVIAHGTGVIVKQDGEILTNAHVVKDMDRIIVVLADGSGYEAELKYFDEECDLALIKIEKSDLETAKFGSQVDITTGKTVIAIGTPVSFSLRNSASSGIISGINRGIGSPYRLIQTDAAINPGNSGGPLVNLNGNVIGINSSKFAGTGIEGLGFSITIDTVNYFLNQYYNYGKVRRPYLGVTFEEDWAAMLGLPSNNGLNVVKDGKNNSMLKEGDILLAVNGCKVNTIVDLNEEMKKYLPDDTVSLKVIRSGIIQEVTAVLTEK